MLKYKINIDKENINDGYLNIPMDQLFYPNAEQYEGIEERFDINNLNVINPTIDYENVKLHPVVTGSTYNDISLLNFNLHFYINNNWTLGASLLSDVGYINDDVENKRKRLDNSFLRLSFYDSSDLNTQNLLYYSTIFIDSGDLYSQFIMNNSSISGSMMEFSVENPKISTEIKSFEGFYIYLFGSDILKNTISTIYLKVEYNSALNGKTSLFLQNRSIDSNGFNLSDLISNMFIPISIEYSTTLNKYIYWFNGYNEQILTLDLYQAKVI